MMPMMPKTLSPRALETAAAAAALMLTLVVASAAVTVSSPMGLPGCVTSCGDVEVPYPFGIGPANCSLPGFNLTCNDRSHALLLGDLQVKGIDLDNTLITVVHGGGDVKISWSDDSLNGHGQLFAGRLRDDGPYRLSSQNELTVLSCNTAATLRNGNVTMSACFTFCEAGYGSKAHYPSRSGCSGMLCCHAPIITNLVPEAEGKLVHGASYDVQIKRFGLNQTTDELRVAVQVLVATEGWFDQHFGSYVLDSQQPRLAGMPIPVWLEWEVVGHGAAAPDSNDGIECTTGPRGGYTCSCSPGYQGNPYLPDGCKDINECDHKEQNGCFGQCNNTQGSFQCGCPPGTRGNHQMPGGCVNSNDLTGQCQRWCGNISVPHPFGIKGIGTASCYTPGFNLTCHTTSRGPPRLLIGNYGNFRVKDFDLPNSMVRVTHSGPIINITDRKRKSFYFEGGEGGQEVFARHEVPYSLSVRNELILMGCNAKATMYEDEGYTDKGYTDIISGCASFCSNNVTERYIQEVRRCYGTGCCQARISMATNGMMPTVVRYQQIDMNQSPMPAYVLIAEAGWFDDQQNFTGSVAAKDVPMLLQWELLPVAGRLPQPDAKSHPNCTQQVIQEFCKSMHSYCKPGNRGYTCHCKESYHGNPYSPDDDGCTGGHRKHLTTGVYIAIGVAIGAGLILSGLGVVFIYKKVKHRRAKLLRWKFFEKNRGRLLQQLVSQRADIAERMIISLEELEKATNNFDKSRELGGGGHHWWKT